MKRSWQFIFEACRRGGLFLGIWSAMFASAWAKDGDVEKGGGGGNSSIWVMAYMFVILGVALGMLVVCKSSGRRTRAKPEAYAEGKGTQEKKKPE